MVKKLFLLSTVLFGLLFLVIPGKCFADASTQTVRAVAPNPTGLVAHYEFEGDAVDISGFRPPADGTLVGNPTFGPGVFGQAIDLDGDGDYVDCGNESFFDITAQITVAAWIKVSEFDKKYQAIVTKGDNSWRLGRASGSNNIEFACNGTAATRWTGWGEIPWAVSGTTSVNDGKWHHIAGVFDGTRLYLYIDGVLEATKAAGNSIDISNHDMCIGANAQVPGREWNGLIDDVRIYNYALSQAEIVSIMGKSEIYLALPVPATLYDIAKRYDGLKKFEEAKGVYQLILQRYSDSSSASGAQIYISKRNIVSFIESKNFNQAQAELDNLIADVNDHPDLPEAFLTIAVSYGWAKKYEEAENIYERIIKRYPESPSAAQARFKASSTHIFSLILSGNYTEAQTAIDKFVDDFTDNPSVAGVLFWFGKEFEALKRYQESKSAYQKVIFLYPDNSHALKAELKVPNMDVLSLIESGNDTAAEAALDTLIADFNDHRDLPEAISNIEAVYYTRILAAESSVVENYLKPVKVWEKVMKRFPDFFYDDPDLYYFIADCYRHMGEYGKAIQYYGLVADKWTQNGYAVVPRTVVPLPSETSSDYEAVHNLIDRLIIDFNDHPGLAATILRTGYEYRRRANEAQREGLTSEAAVDNFNAIVLYERVIKEFPSSPFTASAYFFSALSYRDVGQWQYAMDCCNHLLDNWPDYKYAAWARRLAQDCSERLAPQAQ